MNDKRRDLDITQELSAEENEYLKEKERRRIERFLNDLRRVVKDPEGRRVVYSFIEKTDPFRTSFSSDALEMARREGRKQIGLSIIQDLDAAKPGVFLQMNREYMSEKKQEMDRDKEHNAAKET